MTYQCLELFTNHKYVTGEPYEDRASLAAWSDLDAAKAYARNFGHRHRTTVIVLDGPHTYDPEIFRYSYPGKHSQSRYK